MESWCRSHGVWHDGVKELIRDHDYLDWTEYWMARHTNPLWFLASQKVFVDLHHNHTSIPFGDKIIHGKTLRRLNHYSTDHSFSESFFGGKRFLTLTSSSAVRNTAARSEDMNISDLPSPRFFSHSSSPRASPE